MLTFLFSDIEGSTRLWEQEPTAMAAALSHHDSIFRQTIDKQQGRIFKTGGDAFFIVFDEATPALEAAIQIQQGLGEYEASLQLRVRMALYTGEAEQRDGDYFGSSLNRAARLLGAAHGGQILLPAATQAAVNPLPEVAFRDLGRHRFKDIDDAEHVFQVLAPRLPSVFPPIRSLKARPTNLSAPLTSFVGREKETAAICAMLRRPQLRLLTLTGTGGIGKTRLSLQVAEAMRDEFEDGVFFVGLETVTQATRIMESIAHQLNIQENTDQLIDQTLKDFLAGRRILVLLDNFEQVIDGAAVVNDLLKAALGLKVLVTSREELSVYGEHIYPVSPLLIPDQIQAPADMLHYPAVVLFVERSQAMQPDFSLTADNSSMVMEICQRLDGLPLALELAAARMKHLPLEQIIAQLTDRLTLLASTFRDLSPRQRTMRGAIDWSYSLLLPEEQKAFAQLGIFAGRFTPEAGQAVTGGANLLTLVDKNLLQHDTSFWFLGVVRDYALEILAAGGDEKTTAQQHASYYRDLLETAEPHLTGAEQDQWFEQLATAYDNLRAALEWSLQAGEWETAARIASVLWRFWNAHSYLNEAQRYLDQILSHIDGLSVTLRIKLLFGAGRLALFRQHYIQAEKLLHAALMLTQEKGDRNREAYILLSLGESKTAQEDYLHAEQFLLQSWVLFRDLDDPTGLARSLESLGNIAHMLGNYEIAIFFLEQSLNLEKRRNSLEGQALALNNLAEVWRVKGDFAQATIFYYQSLTLFRRLKWAAAIATVLLNLGHTYRRQGDYPQAESLFREGLELLKEVDEQTLMAECLAGLSMILASTDQLERAAILFGAVHTLLESLDASLDPVDRQDYLSLQASLQSKVGDAVWLQMWGKGLAMSLDQAVVYAQEI